ncbi:MAG: hypothetical protein ACMUIU_18515 [bacterium]
MLREKRLQKWGIISLVVLVSLLLFCAPSVQAQWAALPPYNLLWPLWSPPLVTDFNWDPLVLAGTIPIITELTRNTILPVQPGIIWDPVLNPKGPVWLLYNVPPAFGSGLTFFEDIYGFMPFPPNYLLDPVTSLPSPITLLPGYSLYLPTKLTHFETTIDFANLLYTFLYGLTPADYLGLLTPAQLWGIPPIP